MAGSLSMIWPVVIGIAPSFIEIRRRILQMTGCSPGLVIAAGSSQVISEVLCFEVWRRCVSGKVPCLHRIFLGTNVYVWRLAGELDGS